MRIRPSERRGMVLIEFVIGMALVVGALGALVVGIAAQVRQASSLSLHTRALWLLEGELEILRGSTVPLPAEENVVVATRLPLPRGLTRLEVRRTVTVEGGWRTVELEAWDPARNRRIAAVSGLFRRPAANAIDTMEMRP